MVRGLMDRLKYQDYQGQSRDENRTLLRSIHHRDNQDLRHGLKNSVTWIF